MRRRYRWLTLTTSGGCVLSPSRSTRTSIGVFSTCEGLGLEVVMEQREEGGNNTMVWQLPTRMKYTNIKLSRPIGPDSHKLTKWITKALQGVKPTTAVISAKSADGKDGREMVAERRGPRPLDRSDL